MPVITTMYAKPRASHSCSVVSGARGKSPISSPRSEITSSTPSGTAMNRTPTAAKLSASRRRLKTTNRSARSPVMAPGCYPASPPRAEPRGRPRVGFAEIGTVIDRDQVLHVALLARLRLTDEEVERMSRELSGILEHVDRMNRLELEGVEPTSHVVELENVLRADEPRPSWPKEEILQPAPDPAEGAFRVPSPQAES